MIKNIIREVAPEACDFRTYFEDGGLTRAAGDYCYTLFIVSNEGWGRISGFNLDEYNAAQRRAERIIDAFPDVGTEYGYDSYKQAMENIGIDYTPRRCHALKEWAKTADAYNTEDMAAFLSIDTGKKWNVLGVCGYCQGDYVQVIYCEGFHDRKQAEAYGEIWMGCGKEFCVIDVDEDGNETDECYGYIIADCQAWQDEDYKKLVCEWAGINEEETRLEMIDGSTTQTIYSYRVA